MLFPQVLLSTVQINLLSSQSKLLNMTLAAIALINIKSLHLFCCPAGVFHHRKLQFPLSAVCIAPTIETCMRGFWLDVWKEILLDIAGARRGELGKGNYIWARSVLETISDTKLAVVEKNLEGGHLQESFAGKGEQAMLSVNLLDLVMAIVNIVVIIIIFQQGHLCIFCVSDSFLKE